MNSQIKRLIVIVAVMFLALMLATTWIQFFQAPQLMADGRNTRIVKNALGRARGPIIVAGNPIASSTPVKDASGHVTYQRRYAFANGMYSALTGFYSTSRPATGLEGAANQQLTGDAPALLLDRIKHQLSGKPVQGGAIELTVNPAVQQAAFTALGNRRGAAVALDVKTGAVLAAVSTPSYDPNKLASQNTAEVNKYYQALVNQDLPADAKKAAKATAQNNPNSPLVNRAFGTHTYAPGSAFKLVTASAMLSSGQFNPDTHVDAPRSISLPQTTKKLANIDNMSCGEHPTLQYAFKLSCNTPFALNGMKLGQDQLDKMARAYGFNSPLQIPLRVPASRFPSKTGEHAVTLAPPQVAYSAIGQGSVQVTPLQMAMVAQTIANGGTEMKPYVVGRELDSKLNPTRTTSPRQLGKPISPQVAQQLTQMMVAVVNEGTAKAARGRIQIAGKTGTAQRGDSGIADGWFVGFAPADKPQIAFAVVVEGDQNGVRAAHGGDVAAPIAKHMVKAAVQHG